MIGAINGPDAADAVAWLEDQAFAYLDACARLRVLRRTAERRARRYERANGDYPARALLSPTERAYAKGLSRVARDFTGSRGDGVFRPIFQYIRCDPSPRGPGTDAARWPRPFPHHDLGPYVPGQLAEGFDAEVV